MSELTELAKRLALNLIQMRGRDRLLLSESDRAVITLYEALRAPQQSGWMPIESASKKEKIIGAWKDGKWQVAELWWDDSVDEWTHTGGDYYCKPTYWIAPPQSDEGA